MKIVLSVEGLFNFVENEYNEPHDEASDLHLYTSFIKPWKIMLFTLLLMQPMKNNHGKTIMAAIDSYRR